MLTVSSAWAAAITERVLDVFFATVHNTTPPVADDVVVKLSKLVLLNSACQLIDHTGKDCYKVIVELRNNGQYDDVVDVGTSIGGGGCTLSVRKVGANDKKEEEKEKQFDFNVHGSGTVGCVYNALLCYPGTSCRVDWVTGQQDAVDKMFLIYDVCSAADPSLNPSQFDNNNQATQNTVKTSPPSASITSATAILSSPSPSSLSGAPSMPLWTTLATQAQTLLTINGITTHPSAGPHKPLCIIDLAALLYLHDNVLSSLKPKFTHLIKTKELSDLDLSQVTITFASLPTFHNTFVTCLSNYVGQVCARTRIASALLPHFPNVWRMLMRRAVLFDKLLEILSKWLVKLRDHQIVLKVLLQMDETRERVQEKNMHVKRIAWQRIKVLREMAKKKATMMTEVEQEEEDDDDDESKSMESECWVQPEAIIQGFPEITAFLRSNKRAARFTCFDGCKQAEGFVRAHFCGDQQPDITTPTASITSGQTALNVYSDACKRRNPGDLHPTERHRAVATFGGRGSTAFVVIEKVEPGVVGSDGVIMHGRRTRQWAFDEDELKLLNKLYHGPNPNRGVKRPLPFVMEVPRPTVATVAQPQPQSVTNNGDGDGDKDGDDDDVPLAKRPPGL